MATNGNTVSSNDNNNCNNDQRKLERSATILSSKEITCGIGGFQPQFFFASAKIFVINFSILAILQGAVFTYMIGIISTLEKRYAFETKVSGFLLIADNLSEMVLSPIVGYLGSKYNRSRLIAFGEMVVVLSCLLSALPYFIYGTATHLGSHGYTNSSSSSINFDLCSVIEDSSSCQLDVNDIDGGGGRSTVIAAVVILWIACLLNGLGYTAFYTIGLPYVDDNIKKKNSPLYLSTISTIRLLGPTLGFTLSSISLRFYENPLMPPSFDNRDPRWIGAWWIGFIVLGLLIFLFTIPMFFFPKSFIKIEESETKRDKNDSTFQDVRKRFVRFSKNSLLLCHIIGGVFRLVGYLGYYIVKPKYIELQYRQSASSASFFTGITSVATMAIGTMVGGLMIRSLRPSARIIAIFVVLVEFLSSVAIFGGMFLQCPTPRFFGLEQMNPSINPLSTNNFQCNQNCDCSVEVYQPVCNLESNMNYFSPCFAGCKEAIISDQGSGILTFHNCSCASSTSSIVTSGLCQNDCNRFPMYITLIAISNTIASLSRTGDTLLTLRAVDQEDKSFAMGIMGTIFAVFAFIPYPLIFGALIDSTCLIWEKTCGKTGNCWLYDLDKYRPVMLDVLRIYMKMNKKMITM
ncbi:solute carrier organic anion transporter family member 5a1-like protein [Dermatophagoides farinae]|uniref:Solute carrier organic anion transporter family member n=1 Tax=Dermatophagoides farinae TaxID=6954 RepID=A0A9D4SD05_DERFA|nr:solute carrier organic anion transporter family member 5a1-like protein [Dermatophagoides farinae]